MVLCYLGGVHGLYQIVGKRLVSVKSMINRRLHTKTDSFSYKFGQMAITFILTDFAWIFFRAETLPQALEIIKKIFCNINLWTLFDGSLYNCGLDVKEIHILFVSILVLFMVDLIKYKNNLRLDLFLEKQCIWFRWVTILVLLFSCVIFGNYGPDFNSGQFIYFQF